MQQWRVAGLVLFHALLAQLLIAAAEPPLALMHITVIDATGRAPVPDRTVLIEDGRIVGIHPSKRFNVPAAFQVVDGTGKFLIPGLWDMHVHTLWKGAPAVSYPLFLANGVIGLRDMGGDLKVLADTRQQMQTGALPPLHLRAAGPLLDARVYAQGSTLAINSVAQANTAVDLLAKRHVDFIKVGTFLRRAPYLAIARAALRNHLTLAGHVPFSVTAEEAARDGQKSMEHLTGLLEGCTPTPLYWQRQLAEEPFGRVSHITELIGAYNDRDASHLWRLLARKKVFQTPTLTVARPFTYATAAAFFERKETRYLTPELREEMRGSGQFLYRFQIATALEESQKHLLFQRYLFTVRALRDAHVPLLAGTDTYFTVPGFGLHEELELLVMAGLTPLEAIQTATRNAARFFRQEKETGTIQRGKSADLVILNKDPLSDIRNTQQIDAVILSGHLYDRAALDAILQDAERRNQKR